MILGSNMKSSLDRPQGVGLSGFLLGCASLLLLPVFGADALPTRDIAIRFQPSWGDSPVHLNQFVGEDGARAPLSVSRLDFIVSQAALQREDGTWLETADWFACIRTDQGRNTAILEGVPGHSYRALRFQIGVGPAVNKSDPSSWAPGHDLNPEVNGLHWGWSGGYVFMALEGHRKNGSQGNGGYSFHIANDRNLMTIELPLALPSQGVGTLNIRLDLKKVFRGQTQIDFEKHGTSTHSREGDPLAAILRQNIQSAFCVASIQPDRYQTVNVIQKSAKTQLRTFPLSISKRLPQAAVPEDNVPTIEGVALGERLFHEPRLSKNNQQSCASCHDRSAAFADAGKRFSIGAEGQVGSRNAMPLFNLIWEKEFFWDGRVAGLRNQVLKPIQDAHEMNESLDRVSVKLGKDGGYADGFAKVFGDPVISSERMGLALEQYLHTLISQDSKFDRAVLKQTQLTPSEARGLQLFVTENDPRRGLRGADCFHCHGGMLFTDHAFHNNGLRLDPKDIGRMAVTRLPFDRGKFKTPSLRNIALTAPYMHDGRFGTLEEVVEHYDKGVQRSDTLDPNLAKHPDEGLGLTSSEKADLVAFLRTLTDEAFTGQREALSQTVSKRP